MIEKHPEIADAHHDNEVDASVGTAVSDSVIEHQNHRPAERSADGRSERYGNLGPHRGDTLPEPRTPPADACVDDQLGIMATSMGERWSEAGEASRNDDHEDEETVSKTSDGGLENRANPAPPPGTTYLVHDGGMPLTGLQRHHCSTILLHNRAPRLIQNPQNTGKNRRPDCYTTIT